MSPTVYFYGSVVLLAVLLFLPVSRLIWVLSVRRLERRTKRKLSEEEIQGQLTRARMITVVIVAIFSFLFNARMLGVPTDG